MTDISYSDILSRKKENDMSSPTPPPAPKWVKISGIVAAVLLLAFLIAQVLGVGGEHGPGRHASPAHAATGAEPRP